MPKTTKVVELFSAIEKFLGDNGAGDRKGNLLITLWRIQGEILSMIRKSPNSFSPSALLGKWEQFKKQVQKTLGNLDQNKSVNQLFTDLQRIISSTHDKAPTLPNIKSKHNNSYIGIKKTVNEIQKMSTSRNSGNTQLLIDKLKKFYDDIPNTYSLFFQTTSLTRAEKTQAQNNVKSIVSQLIKVLESPQSEISEITIPSEFDQISDIIKSEESNKRLVSPRPQTPPPISSLSTIPNSERPKRKNLKSSTKVLSTQSRTPPAHTQNSKRKGSIISSAIQLNIPKTNSAIFQENMLLKKPCSPSLEKFQHELNSIEKKDDKNHIKYDINALLKSIESDLPLFDSIISLKEKIDFYNKEIDLSKNEFPLEMQLIEIEESILEITKMNETEKKIYETSKSLKAINKEFEGNKFEEIDIKKCCDSISQIINEVSLFQPENVSDLDEFISTLKYFEREQKRNNEMTLILNENKMLKQDIKRINESITNINNENELIVELENVQKKLLNYNKCFDELQNKETIVLDGKNENRESLNKIIHQLIQKEMKILKDLS